MVAQPEGSGPQPPGPGSGQSLNTTGRRLNEQTRERSPFMFLVIGLCFFLPFISISCSGQRLGTLSGIQLVTGDEIDIDEQALEQQFTEAFGTTGTTEADDEAPSDAPENDPSIFAIIALAAAVLGVIAGFVTRGRTRAMVSFAAALAGLVGLIGLRFDLQGDVSEGEGLISVDYRLGYWISALLFLALALSHGTYLRGARRTGPPSTGPPGPGP